MNCIIAGPRYIKNYQHVLDAVKASGFTIGTVVSGRAKGVDSLGERWAEEHGVTVKPFPADWDKYKRAAGIVRNREMAKYADALVAVWDGKSRGTGDMIKHAREKGLLVYVHRVEQGWWVSSEEMSFSVTTVDNKIIDSAPIGQKFIGQHLIKLLNWMKKQGGLRVHQYVNE
jgi:hypothetical protein